VKIRRIVDLTVALDARTQVYPGDPAVSLDPVASIDADGFNLLGIRMGSQSGTNCDAPYHVRAGGTPIDEVDLRLFAGPARRVDVRGLAPRSPIAFDRIREQVAGWPPGTILLLWTGWSAWYGSDAYLDHPFLTPAACEALLALGVRTIGLDTMSVDETPVGPVHGPTPLPCHHLIADAGGVVVENLTHLELVDFPHPFVCMLPLRLTGADGSPIRAVAMSLSSGPQ
jgi:kynurenine formamidase